MFLGANQVKVPLDVARELQAFGPDAEYVQIDGNGSNALDFHIAFYIGRLAAQTPGAQFHVISNDTGFDPLIRHVNKLGIACRRSDSTADIAKPLQAAPTSMSARVDAAIENLVKRKAAKPRTLKTLRASLKAFFGNQLDEEAIDQVMQQLAERKALTVVDGKIQYQLPS